MNKVSFGLALKSGLTAGIFAAVLNIVLFEVVVFFSRLPFLVPIGPDGKITPITIPMIIAGCLAPAFVASVLFWGLVKIPKVGVLVFSVLAYAVLLATFYPVLMLNAHRIEKTVLILMHIITALMIIRKLKKAEREGVTTSEPAQTIQPMQ